MSHFHNLAISTAVIAAVAASIALAAGGGGGGGAAATGPATTATAPGAGGGRGGRGGRGGPAAPPPASEGVKLPSSALSDGKPQINGPRITGATPGKPFFFQIPATGDNLTFSADGLPDGLTLDSKTGLITGSLKALLATAVTLHAKNDKGESTRQFVIVGGTHKLALTPPLGWNSWNCYGGSVTEDQMKAAADGMMKSGLAVHGFAYVNLDDGWNIRGSGANTRNDDGSIKPNPKFPDMKGLGEYVHAKGLKFGIYSGPGPTTCQGLAAAWQHEQQDAKTWASWGVDYIKYDWCNYDEAIGGRPQMSDLPALQKPYQLLRTCIDNLDRDVTYSLCQYGWGNVWTWGDNADINGNLWQLALATSPPGPMSGCPCRASGSSRTGTKNMPGPATGTIPTCSWWAAWAWPMAARPSPPTSPRTSSSHTSASGPCWPLRCCWVAT